MHQANCLNCNAELAAVQHFCSNCGQKNPVHRITFSHVIHEFFHAFTHADKGILFLLKELTLRPGQVAREYVAGKRKKYFNPFTFFLLVMGLFVFSNSMFLKSDMPAQPDPKVLARMPTQEARDNYTGVVIQSQKASHFMSHYSNVVGMIAVPFLSLITWLFYRRRGYNYAEHLTGNLLFTSYNNLLFAVLVVPLDRTMTSAQNHAMLLGAGMLVHAVYLSWGLSGYMQLRGWWNRVKTFLVATFATALWACLSVIGVMMYITADWRFWKLLNWAVNKQ